MDIETLRYMVALEKYRSFSEAAYQCSVSQSSFSKHIQKAEDELGGIELFDRSSRPPKITKAGRELVSYAKRITADYDDLRRAMKQYSELYQQELRIGSIPIMGSLGISRLLKGFMNNAGSRYDIKICDLPSKKLLDALLDEIVDVAFFALFPNGKVDSGITYYTLHNYELNYVISSSNPLARKKSVSWADIMGEHFISQSESSQMYDICREALVRRGYDWNTVTTFQSITSIVDYVGSGFGGTLLSKHAISKYVTDSIAVIPMEEPIEYSLALGYCNRGNLKTGVKQLIDFALSWNL